MCGQEVLHTCFHDGQDFQSVVMPVGRAAWLRVNSGLYGPLDFTCNVCETKQIAHPGALIGHYGVTCAACASKDGDTIEVTFQMTVLMDRSKLDEMVRGLFDADEEVPGEPDPGFRMCEEWIAEEEEKVVAGELPDLIWAFEPRRNTYLKGSTLTGSVRTIKGENSGDSSS
jgi:hypothetical protein